MIEISPNSGSGLVIVCETPEEATTIIRMLQDRGNEPLVSGGTMAATAAHSTRTNANGGGGYQPMKKRPTALPAACEKLVPTLIAAGAQGMTVNEMVKSGAIKTNRHLAPAISWLNKAADTMNKTFIKIASQDGSNVKVFFATPALAKFYNKITATTATTNQK